MHTHRNDEIFELSSGECEILDFSSVCSVWHPPSLPCCGSFTSSEYLHIELLLTYKPRALFQICVLTNTCVDKHHLLLQKRFEKTGTFTTPSLASSWPCLLPGSRKAKPSSAWLKGAANVDSDKKILLSWFLRCLFWFVLFTFEWQYKSWYFIF